MLGHCRSDAVRQQGARVLKDGDAIPVGRVQVARDRVVQRIGERLVHGPVHLLGALLQGRCDRSASGVENFPMGLSLDRIFQQTKDVPFKDEVWPKFLRDNARRVLRLD